MSENEKKPMTRQEFEEQIIKKAQSDEDFRKALKDNPKEALGQLGVQLPAEIEVKVVEESPEVLYLVLPADPGELTVEQLDRVAGGDRGYFRSCEGYGFWGCPIVACACY
ncbi:MAG: NHLP leader peptide family RiPP precursor [Peptococcaceae bacterium]|nr:NHLP leader peptide family RiPP precursor [Peptococcaceae bacterium]